MSSGMPFTDLYPEGAGGAGGGPGGAGGAADVNVDWPGLPPGAVPVHRDRTFTAAGTYDLVVPPSDKSFVLVSAYIATDVAGRIAIVDESDVEGSRYVVQYPAANGGSSPNLVPAPRQSASPGNRCRAVIVGVGNVFVRVSGYYV